MFFSPSLRYTPVMSGLYFPLSKNDAQQRANEIAVFRHELDRLEQDDVLHLSANQRSALADYYDDLLDRLTKSFDIDSSQRAGHLTLGMRIASFLGALALAASVFFLIKKYWNLFSIEGQVAILSGSSLLTLTLAVFLRRHDRSGYFVKLAALIAGVTFVVNIVLLGQIFNITPSEKAFLLWAVYAFLLAYGCDLRLLLVAGIGCLGTYAAAVLAVAAELPWDHFTQRPETFFPAALVMLIIPLVFKQQRYSGFDAIYRIFGLLMLFIPMLMLGFAGQTSFINETRNWIEGFYQILGFVGTVVFVWLGVWRLWPETTNTALVLFVAFLCCKMFSWWWDTMPKYLFFLVLGLVAILFLLILQRLRAALSAGRQSLS